MTDLRRIKNIGPRTIRHTGVTGGSIVSAASGTVDLDTAAGRSAMHEHHRELLIVGDPPGNVVAGATFSAAAEAGDERVVSVQLKDYLGADLAISAAVPIYASTDSSGNSPTDVVAVSAGTDGSMVAPQRAGGYTDPFAGCSIFKSEADGDIDVVVSEYADANATYYLNAILPSGEVVTSGPIAFVDDTP